MIWWWQEKIFENDDQLIIEGSGVDEKKISCEWTHTHTYIHGRIMPYVHVVYMCVWPQFATITYENRKIDIESVI